MFGQIFKFLYNFIKILVEKSVEDDLTDGRQNDFSRAFSMCSEKLDGTSLKGSKFPPIEPDCKCVDILKMTL
jgi:hypothetical protein